jgi:hypothetical protein
VKTSARTEEEEEAESVELHRRVLEQLDKEEQASGEAEGGPSCSSQKDSCPATPLSAKEELEATRVFFCPEPGCTATYSSQARLDKHWEFGNHRYVSDRESLLDFALGQYVERIEARGLEPVRLHGEGIIGLAPPPDQPGSSPPLQMGWALHRPKSPVRYTEEQKKFLEDLFWKGEATK